jgi:ADP-ribose pyrophosphatase
MYKRIARNLVHKGSIIDFYNDTIKIDEDERLKTFDFIDHKGASAMIPIDSEDNILMVRQHRNAIDQYTLEIPAGSKNAGEDSRTCAIRECEEETGYRAGEVHHLIDVYTTVAFSNEKICIYYTTGIIPTSQHLDEDEFVTVERHSLDELTGMIFTGEITDAKTVAAILALKTKLELNK